MRTYPSPLPWVEEEIKLIKKFAEKINNKECTIYEATKELLQIMDYRSWEAIRSKLYKERKGLIYESMTACIECKNYISESKGTIHHIIIKTDKRYISVVACSDKCAGKYLRDKANEIDPQFPDYIDLAH